MKHNTMTTYEGIEVYEHKIYEYADEYISKLDNPDSINKNSSLFTGMIKYIYINVFKPNKNTVRYNNKNTNINMDNVELLDDIWDIYTNLCYKYQKRPTLLNFGLLTGITTETFRTWKNGEVRGGVTSPHSVSVKKWLEECESSLLDGATENNSIGCIFALKSNYGYTEQPQRIEVVNGQVASQTVEEIAARHGIKNTEDIQDLIPPELPDLE